jgi:hypothetical protein
VTPAPTAPAGAEAEADTPRLPQANLFDLAPYRRIRGAVPAWLLSWADADPVYAAAHRHLHERGREFLAFLLAAGGRDAPDPDACVTVHRGLDGADLVALVDDGTALVVVERAERRLSYHQLDRIRARLAGRFGPENLCLVYLELGNQPSHAAIRAAGFHVVGRRELLSHGRGWWQSGLRHAILEEYYDHLQGIEQTFHDWRRKPPDGWSDRNWQGFLSALQDRFGDGTWGRLDRAEGRPWALWWNRRRRPQSPLSYLLRIEGERICFRLCLARYETGLLVEARATWLEHLRDAADKAGVPLSVPERPGWRSTQTVCQVEDYLRLGADGRLDFEETLAVVRQAERVFEAGCAGVGAVAGWGRG